MALRYHPDKVLSSSSTSSIDPHQKFQQIGFAYSVLSDEARRKRYDATGKTNESMFEQDGFSWDEYFKEMWQGSVSGEKLDEFKKKFQRESGGRPKWSYTRRRCSMLMDDYYSVSHRLG
jgi:DnaJ family protein C protein 9